MPAGRPLKFETSKQMQDAVDSYLKDNNIPTISGLAYYLGFESRQSFYDYEQREEFSYTVKRCRLFMESWYESRLQGNNPAGSIFWLKNAGWSDKQEIDQTSTIKDERIDSSKLTEDELRILAEIQRKSRTSQT